VEKRVLVWLLRIWL